MYYRLDNHALVNALVAGVPSASGRQRKVNWPRVSIVVPVWNGEATIGATVRSLLEQEYPSDALEIIVVDNGSSDRTRDVVADFPRVTLLEQEKPGSYAARNVGLNHASGKYIAFTDADCVADPKWLMTAISKLESDTEIGVLAGHIEVVPCTIGSRQVFLIERELSFRQEDTAQQGRCATANWVSPLHLIAATGGFNENVKSGGDWLLSSKISARGIRIVYEAGAIVRHKSRERLVDLLQKRRRVTGGQWARRGNGLLRHTRAAVAAGLRSASRIIRSPSLRPSEKAAVLPIVLLMSAASVGELFRLALGGTPRRA